MHRTLLCRQQQRLVIPSFPQPARQVAGNVRRSCAGRAPSPSVPRTHQSQPRRAFASASTHSLSNPHGNKPPASEPPSSSDAAPASSPLALSALLPFFDTIDPTWSHRIQTALRANAPTVTLISLTGPSGSDDVLSSLLEDALVDLHGDTLLRLADVRSRTDAQGHPIIRFGHKVHYDEAASVLSVPLPWLRESALQLKEIRAQDLTDQQDTATQIYTSPQVLIVAPYDLLFSLTPPAWLTALKTTLKTFAAHPGLQLVVSQRNEIRSQEEQARVKGKIAQWIDATDPLAAPFLVSFVDVSKAKEAQGALRRAMGFDGPDGPSSSSSSSSRSQQWTLFQSLSADSGLPNLINSLRERQHIAAHHAVLQQHAQEEITSRIRNAQADLEALSSQSTYLSTTATRDSQALLTSILSDVRDGVLSDVTASASAHHHEPALLPKWWKLPFIGDVETRQRVQEALQDTWLGGEATEQKLIWWSGRLAEIQRAEQRHVQDTLRDLEQRHRLPQSLLLEIRARALSPRSSTAVTTLAEPVTRARDHLFGRTSRLQRRRTNGAGAPTTRTPTAAGYGPTPTQGGISILDNLQRRVQNIIYRFYATVGGSIALSTWGLASRALDLTTAPMHWTNSTSLAILAFGSTYALWSLQRSHSRLTLRLLTRDVLKRIPANVLAEVEGVSVDALQGGVYRSRSELARSLDAWVRERQGVVSNQEQRWNAVRRAV